MRDSFLRANSSFVASPSPGGYVAARTVYLAFDADSNGSGQQAAQRLASRLREYGLDARRVSLPNGYDPNSFFVHGGDAIQFQCLLEAARS
jgi:DNA primase